MHIFVFFVNAGIKFWGALSLGVSLNENNLVYLFLTLTVEVEIKHSFCSS